MAGIRMFLTTLCIAYFLGWSFADDESSNNCDCEKMNRALDTLRKLLAVGMLNEDTFNNLQTGMKGGNLDDTLDKLNSQLDIMDPIAVFGFDPKVMKQIFNLNLEDRTAFLNAFPAAPEDIQKFIAEFLKVTDQNHFPEVAKIIIDILSKPDVKDLVKFAAFLPDYLSPEFLNNILQRMNLSSIGLSTDVLGKLGKLFSGALGVLVNGLINTAGGIVANTLGGALDGGMDAVGGVAGGALDAVGGAAGGALNGALDAAGGALDAAGGAVDALGGLFGGGKHSVSSGQGGAGKGWGGNGGPLGPVSGLVDGLSKTVGDVVHTGMGAVGEAANTLGELGNAGGLLGDKGTAGGSAHKHSFFPG